MRAPPELTSESDIADARLALDRCATDADFSAWARTWGRPAIEGLRELTARGRTDHYDMED